MKKSIYLDNCATTKPYREVAEAVASMMTEYFGTPSSQHMEGRRAKEILESSRRTVADALGAEPEEIYFTSGGTEADNIAVLGVCEGKDGPAVSTTVEHPAVHKPLSHLRRSGRQIRYIPITGGALDMNKARELITPDTVLVSAMLVNNETGTILPGAEIAEIIKRQAPGALLHCDAVQGFGKLRFTAKNLGADLICISGHKIHGPKGIGALYVKKGTQVSRRVYGGGQEKGLRSGTEAMPLIAGFAEAVRITMYRLDADARRMRELKEYAIGRLEETFDDAVINSPADGAPHIVSFYLPGLKNAQAAAYLSDNGVCVSTSAACKSNHARGPSMLMSFGLSAEAADSTLRVGLCAENSEEELDHMIELLKTYRRENK
jgi:cysteine desulfurase